MEDIIFGLIFLGVCVNPAMALRYIFMFSFSDERNIRFVKRLQVFNAVVSVVLLVLVTILFNRLAEGHAINW